MAVTDYCVIDGEVVSEIGNGTERDYVPDPLGSTVALLDNTQTKTDTFSYWPYGEVRTSTGSNVTPFRFVGTLGYYRDSTSRTYVRAREYQQNYGRWMTVDPLWPTQPSYCYAISSPVSVVDSSGRNSCDPLDDPCKDYMRPSGFWGSPVYVSHYINAAQDDSCKAWDPATLAAILRCVITYESRGHPKGYGWPLDDTKDPVGPCQIVKGGDKDKICIGLSWRTSPADHVRCCMRILCQALGKRGKIISAGTRWGRNKKGEVVAQGQFQVINFQKQTLDLKFFCCLKSLGVDPTKDVPRRQ